MTLSEELKKKGGLTFTYHKKRLQTLKDQKLYVSVL